MSSKVGGDSNSNWQKSKIYVYTLREEPTGDKGMPSRRRLVDVTKLTKSSELVQQESEALLQQARAQITRQEELMSTLGMEKQAVRRFINSDQWSTQLRQKARKELIRFSEDLKQAMSIEVARKRKEIRLSSRLLKPKPVSKSTGSRKRTGFI